MLVGDIDEKKHAALIMEGQTLNLEIYRFVVSKDKQQNNNLKQHNWALEYQPRHQAMNNKINRKPLIINNQLRKQFKIYCRFSSKSTLRKNQALRLTIRENFQKNNPELVDLKYESVLSPKLKFSSKFSFPDDFEALPDEILEESEEMEAQTPHFIPSFVPQLKLVKISEVNNQEDGSFIGDSSFTINQIQIQTKKQQAFDRFLQFVFQYKISRPHQNKSYNPSPPHTSSSGDDVNSIIFKEEQLISSLRKKVQRVESMESVQSFTLEKSSNLHYNDLKRTVPVNQLNKNNTNEPQRNFKKYYMQEESKKKENKISSSGNISDLENYFETQRSPEEQEHTGYFCDGCEMQPIKGKRYHCESCEDYDLCEKCYFYYGHQHEMKTISLNAKNKQLLKISQNIQQQQESLIRSTRNHSSLKGRFQELAKISIKILKPPNQ